MFLSFSVLLSACFPVSVSLSLSSFLHAFLSWEALWDSPCLLSLPETTKSGKPLPALGLWPEPRELWSWRHDCLAPAGTVVLMQGENREKILQSLSPLSFWSPAGASHWPRPTVGQRAREPGWCSLRGSLWTNSRVEVDREWMEAMMGGLGGNK